MYEVINLNLSQKEKMLLQDQKSHEEICIEKYTNYAGQVQDPQLKDMFNTYAGQEKQHLNTINQILNGSVPQMDGRTQNQQGQQQSNQQAMQNKDNQTGMSNQNDAKLCNDLLMTEKYVSGTYDTAIFEFADSNVRNVLNHIQKEEQQHGEGILNYMQNSGMYSIQQ
ncbi:MAG: spore coat protein [Firmicutes bacterium]|nr:spore coat protein [Bacillota bacterium]